MNDYTSILNRIKKNKNRLKSYVKDLKLDAYRIYDRDIPEYPYIIDIYGSKLVIFEKGKSLTDSVGEELKRKHLEHITQALEELFPEYERVIKERVRNRGKSQYEKEDNSNNFYVVREGEQLFQVNADDYIDCGLFLDHRPLRAKIKKLSKDKTVLNLFCYTGAISVAAASAPASLVCSVDMSNTYLEWAKRNFEINGIASGSHQFLRENIIKWLLSFQEKFDIIVLDPPSFSNSKKMEESFDIQKDHVNLLTVLKKNLKPDGILFFSNNLRSFRLDPEVSEHYSVRDITKESIPPDFKDPKIHQCFELRLLSRD